MEHDRLMYEFERTADAIKRQGAGVKQENDYSEAYRKLAQVGLKPPLKRKYRGG